MTTVENYKTRNSKFSITRMVFNTLFPLNGVVDRKHRSLAELARMIVNETNLPKYF